jgi:hypothetical protein
MPNPNPENSDDSDIVGQPSPSVLEPKIPSEVSSLDYSKWELIVFNVEYN